MQLVPMRRATPAVRTYLSVGGAVPAPVRRGSRPSRAAAALLIAATAAALGCSGGEAAERFAPLEEALAASRAPAGLASRLSRGEWQRVRAFFEAREYRPAWTSGTGLSPAFHDAVTLIEEADRDALAPDDYDLDWLQAERDRLSGLLSRGSLETDEAIVDAELRTTAAVLRWARHLSAGRFDPRRAEIWIPAPQEPSPEDIVTQAVADGRVDELPSILRPPHGEYAALLKLRERYVALAAGEPWPEVEGKGYVRPGEEDGSVRALRARLAAEGDLDSRHVTDDALLDGPVAAALRAFQERHGLPAEAVLGPATRAALNTSAAMRLRQIDVNIERWRFAPRDLGRRHVRVNIPAYHLALVEDGRVELGMRAVIGSKDTPTPVLSDEMRHIVFSPYWNIPESIVADEVLPRLLNDPDYLRRNDIELVRVEDGTAEVVDASEVDWLGFDPSLRLRQRPGRTNALGKLKFILSNHLNIYLHDTPADGLFSRVSRALSHGCVRVERPVTLAQRLLHGQGWGEQRIAEAMEQGDEHWVRLEEPLPVHLMYITAWTGEDGRAQFRTDVYGHDAIQARALERARPRPAPSPES